jgi:hypothetical protein
MAPQAKFAQHDALSQDQKERYIEIRTELAKKMAQAKIHVLPKGFLFQYESEPGLLGVLSEYISLERVRCPWFRFQITIPPDNGPISMALTADDASLMARMKEELESLGAVLLGAS